jgi:hypothetical protein
MATKKAASSRKSTTSPPAKLTLELLAANQKEINGSLYEALDLVLDIISSTVGVGDIDKLRDAQAIIDAVPGYDPPGCGAGPYPG